MNSSANAARKRSVNDTVVDASAALVVIRREPGEDVVLGAIADGTAFISTVNVAEVISSLIDRGMTQSDAVGALATPELVVVPFTELHALAAAALRPPTRALGLSPGDRACLALGLELNRPILTADRAWAQLNLPVPIVLVR